MKRKILAIALTLLSCYSCNRMHPPPEADTLSVEQPHQKYQEITAKTIALAYNSPYDQQEINYLLQTPLHPTEYSPLFLILAEPGTVVIDQEVADGWYLTIPSRDLMNYQLLAEGDFWKIIAKTKEKYPLMRKSPTYLAGSDENADAALLFANNFRGRFQGIAFSGGRFGLDLANLDHLPIVHYKEENVATNASSPWSGIHLIDRLQKRGNLFATAVKGGVSNAFKELTSLPPAIATLPPFSFEDYSYAQLLPWMRIVAKYSENDPATISIITVGDELVVDAPNVSALEVRQDSDLAFPKKIKRLSLNNRLFALKNQEKSTTFIHERSPQENLKEKARTPAGLINFFRHEPLYIIYQDRGISKEYQKKAQAVAERFSHLDFFGFPKLGVSLPLLPLSQYQQETLPNHRAIIIGHPKKIEPLIKISDNYLPFSRKDGGFKIHSQYYSLVEEKKENEATLTYGLVYPPEASSPLKLSLLLAAEDLQGLETLERHYTSATTLYEQSDIFVWERQHGEDLLVAEEIFNGFWKESEPSQLLIVTPPQHNSVWENYLRELLIEKGETAKLAISPLLDNYLSIPSRITYDALLGVIPQKHFAKVFLRGKIGSKIGEKLLTAIDNPELFGLDSVVSIENVSDEISLHLEGEYKKKTLPIIIDAAALDALSTEELELIDYQILPYSLFEMLLMKIQEEREEFGRDFLRLANSDLEEE